MCIGLWRINSSYGMLKITIRIPIGKHQIVSLDVRILYQESKIAAVLQISATKFLLDKRCVFTYS